MRPARSARAMVMAVAAALLATAVAGCGVSGSDADPPAPTTTATATTLPLDADEAPLLSDTTEAEYVEALAADLAAWEPGMGDLELTDEEAQCIAPRWVDALTVKALQQAGLIAEDMVNFNIELLPIDEERGQTMLDSLVECGAEPALLVGELVAVSTTGAQRDCILDHIDPEQAEQVLVQAFAGDNDAFRTVFGELLDVVRTSCEIPGD